MAEHTPGPWKLILHGNETYPFPLSIQTEDGASWIARDGTVSSLANAALLAAAATLQAENTALKARAEELEALLAEVKPVVGWGHLDQSVYDRVCTALAQGENDG